MTSKDKIDEHNDNMHINHCVQQVDLQSNTVQQRANRLEDNNFNNLLIWKISDSVFVTGEIYHGKTDVITKKNNIDSLAQYLQQNFGEKYLVISFKKSNFLKHLRNCLSFDLSRFHLSTACKIAKISKFWLESGENKVLFIEIRNGVENIALFVLSCILAYNRVHWSAEIALNGLLKANSMNLMFRNSESSMRYARYFDQTAILSSTARFPSKILNQIIITTIPTILGNSNFVPQLKLTTATSVIEISSDKCYIDSNYIVFSGLDIEMGEDIVLSLWFVQEKRAYHILDLSLNCFFYQQGLYRFGRMDIETSLPQESIYQFFDERFCIDLVLMENRELQVSGQFNIDYNIAEAVEYVTESFTGETDQEIFKLLTELEYAPMVCKVCSQLKLDQNECKTINENYISRNLTQFRSKISFKPPNSEPGILDVQQGQKIAFVDAFPINTDNYRCQYAECGDLEIGPISLIELDLTRKSIEKKSRSGLFGKKEPRSTIPIREDLFAIKPLHITSLNNTEDTIFDDLQRMKVDMDVGLFEKHFCSNFDNEKNEKLECVATVHSLIDPKRLFIVSLCFKQLELKGISIGVLESHLKSADISNQELTSILKCIPTDEEKQTLNEISRDTLGSTEKAMLSVSEIPNIRQIVTILLFESTLFDEISRIESIIQRSENLLNIIMTSTELKLLFKIILDVTNNINYVYGKRRKSVDGFKIESLSILISYEGFESYTLLEFIVETLLMNKVEFKELTKIADQSEKMKKDDFTGLKDDINGLILKYQESVKSYEQISELPRQDLKVFLGFACKKIRETIRSFESLQEKIGLVQRKMGEDCRKPINTIFEPLHAFLRRILGVYQAINQRSH